jgi:uncharacterized Zn finger protein
VVSARLTQEDEGDAMHALAEMAEGAGEHAPWTVRLAQRYHGDITREQLMAFAGQAVGHRAEALFYEGMLAFVAGDLAAAERDLRGVLQTEMLRFFEYDMAWEMLARGLPALRAASTAAAATTSSAPSAPAPAASALSPAR